VSLSIVARGASLVPPSATLSSFAAIQDENDRPPRHKQQGTMQTRAWPTLPPEEARPRKYVAMYSCGAATGAGAMASADFAVRRHSGRRRAITAGTGMSPSHSYTGLASREPSLT